MTTTGAGPPYGSKVTHPGRPRRLHLPRLTPELSLAVMAFLLIGFLPLLLYGLLNAGVPTVTALEARQRLTASSSSAALVDIRPLEAYSQGHIPGAKNWPYQEIIQVASTDGLPEMLQNKELLLLGDTGLTSALAVRRLMALSVTVKSVHGGMQAWIATATKPEGETLSTLQTATGERLALPVRSQTLFEQFSVVGASFLIKPIYMLASLLLIIVLWTSTAPDLAALRWGLIFFLAGEIACVINTITYFAAGEQSDLFEYLHGLGMVLCLWFIFFAVLEGLDRRLFNFSHPRRRCAAIPLCRSCIKRQDVPCGLKRFFFVIIPLIAAVALIPLTVRLDATSYNASLLSIPYNFSHPVIHQFYEIRYLPMVTLGLLGTAFLILLFKKKDSVTLARIPFSAAAGALAYSLLMLGLYNINRDNMAWFVFWEEGTELLLIATISSVLWLFREGFFPKAAVSVRS